MSDDTQKVLIGWVCATIILVTLTLAVMHYNVVDRTGPQRPIVTTTQSYQAK